MKNLYYTALALVLPFATNPSSALAQIREGSQQTSGALRGRSIFDRVNDIINDVIPILIGIAVVAFLWGVVSFILAGDAEEKKEKAKNTMLYGIIGIFVMVAIWGIIALLADVLNVGVGGELRGAPSVNN